MATLTRALQDRARIVRSVAVGAKIEGRRQGVPTTLSDFPCRLVLAPSREVDGEGRKRIVQAG